MEHRLWRSCGNVPGFTAVVAFSPNGHRALLRKPARDGFGAYAVVDVPTGTVIRLFTSVAGNQRGLGQAVFERDDSILFALAVGPGAGSVARCSTAGSCELAVAHAAMPHSPGGPLPFEQRWVDKQLISDGAPQKATVADRLCLDLTGLCRLDDRPAGRRRSRSRSA